MRNRKSLISAPLEWPRMPSLAPPPSLPVLAQRGGTQLRTPKPVLIVDTREQLPFDFSRFEGWFSKVKRKALPLGDYSVEGMENLCTVERKGLSDLVRSFTTERRVFMRRLQAMARYPYRVLVITAALSEIKSENFHGANPNGITQSLIALLAGLQVPFLCTETHELGEELVASYLYQVHLYHWLETHGFGAFLADDDL
jgi:ERCC4-type nuclease